METTNKTPEERRAASNAKIIGMGIACFEKLPLLESGGEVALKSVETVANRALACLFSTQVACTINAQGDYAEAKDFFTGKLNEFGVENALCRNEKRVFEGSYTEQDAINVAWTYECYWMLLWAMGMLEDADVEHPFDICDINKAIAAHTNTNPQ